MPQIQTSSVRYNLVAKGRQVEGFLTCLRVSEGFWIEAIIARERSSGDWFAEVRLADTAHRDTRFRVGPCEPPAGEMPFRGLFSSKVNHGRLRRQWLTRRCRWTRLRPAAKGQAVPGAGNRKAKADREVT